MGCFPSKVGAVCSPKTGINGVDVVISKDRSMWAGKDIDLSKCGRRCRGMVEVGSDMAYNSKYTGYEATLLQHGITRKSMRRDIKAKSMGNEVTCCNTVQHEVTLWSKGDAEAIRD